MMILGIETTSRQGSVAIVRDGKILTEYILAQSLRYSGHIIPAINKVFTDAHCELADIDRIAVGNGPGSFTGIRVGMAIVKGLAVNTSMKYVGVPSLLNIAMNSVSNGLCTACIYAQNNEFFAQKFVVSNTGEYVAQNECRILSDEILCRMDDEAVLCGPDVDRLDAAEKYSVRIKKTYPTAGTAARIVAGYSDEHCLSQSFVPLYIRRSVAEIKGPKVFTI